ncbi:uncharacterized protein NPIL_356241 [Nephila pilipes]|uniref:Uncharacterized protein n=1 Tax=Nephila pilipes TaxID=299642 RepID=A0A8X6QMJ6_NEPPI|nr:uncharacterized protein NPIL_356241 [Nephila pilipes]
MVSENRETPPEQWTFMPYGIPMRHDSVIKRNPGNATSRESSDENALASLEKFCKEELKSLSRYRTDIHFYELNQQKMDVARKQNNDTKHCNSPEAKKGKQLTSIIDQLTINKTKDAAPESKSKRKDSQTWQQQIGNDGKFLI